MADAAEDCPLPGLPGDARLSLEFQLLLACSFVPPETNEASHADGIVGLCESGLDWDGFVGLVDRHRVQGLAYFTLERYAGDRVPSTARAELKERNRNVRIQALRHAAELARLARRFDEKNIDLTPLKGTTLSTDLYGDPGLRQSRDIDLMVAVEDLDWADRLLLSEGYERVFPDFEPTAKQKDCIRSFCHHYAYRHIERAVALELHWKFELWTPEQTAEFRRCARPAERAGARVRSLDTGMLLVFLCDHGARHRWFRVKWLSDVAALMARCSKTDGERAVEAAERLDLLRPLAQAALLVHWLYDVPPAEPFAALIRRDGIAAVLARQAVKHILRSEGEHFHPSFGEKWKGRLYLMRLRRGIAHSHHLQKLFMDVEMWKRLPLPDGMFWLYYAFRPLAWFRRHYL